MENKEEYPLPGAMTVVATFLRFKARGYLLVSDINVDNGRSRYDFAICQFESAVILNEEETPSVSARKAV